jgi:hypothetical protein
LSTCALLITFSHNNQRRYRTGRLGIKNGLRF